MSEYQLKSKVELVALCKERGIKGYSKCGITKDKIIKLLNGENMPNEIKNSFGKILTAKQLQNNLFDYLSKNNSSIIEKFAGDINDLKTISYGTMVHYKWKCVNYLECSNIFSARPRDIFRNDTRPPTRYCNNCRHEERNISCRKKMIKKNGSIQLNMPNIVNVWCEENIFKPDELTEYSHKRVKLKCPNKSAGHPIYEIIVYNIQDSNCFSCPKCSLKTSKAEIRIYSELKYQFKDVKWQEKIEGREADIIIEDLKLVIEVDGYPWHMNKMEKDLLKNSIFEKNGYNVLRIRDTKLREITCNTIVCNVSYLSLSDYNRIIEWINNTFNYNISISCEFKHSEYYNELYAGILSIPYESSVECLFPESKEIWDYEKNDPFLPSHFTMGSHTEIWIKCKKNHSFKRPIKQIFRIRQKDKIKRIIKCPDCSIKNKTNKRPITINGVNYKSIINCCKNLKISKTTLYNVIRKNNKDIYDNAVIEEYILKLIQT